MYHCLNLTLCVHRYLAIIYYLAQRVKRKVFHQLYLVTRAERREQSRGGQGHWTIVLEKGISEGS